MEGILKSGVYLAIFRLIICLAQEDYGKARWRFVERDEVTHYLWVYLLAGWRGKIYQDLAYNNKMSAKVHMRRTLGMKVVTK